MAKQIKVLMPSCFHKLRISDELAGLLDDGKGGEDSPQPTALVVNSFGKVWHVEVGKDGGGAFLGHGWPEFVAANGISVGWFLVLRHEGRGVLTVKAFDLTCCLKESGGLQLSTASSNRYGSRKPQFIKVLLPDFMEKMLIPPTFVQRYVSEAHQSNKTAIIASQFGKFWPIEVERDGSGMFLAGGWSQFLAFHGISNGDIVLLRYEGNMVFKLKVFGLNGCQKDLKGQDARTQRNIEKQKEARSSSRNRKRKIEGSSGKEDTRPKGSVISSYKGSIFCSPEIGQPSWIKKDMNTKSLEKYLSLARSFCDWIGFVEHSTITLKTSEKSTKCWQVSARRYPNYGYLGGESWRSFWTENQIREGDVCTFHAVQTAVWHADIMRCSHRTR